jgi:hypothetical protein
MPEKAVNQAFCKDKPFRAAYREKAICCQIKGTRGTFKISLQGGWKTTPQGSRLMPQRKV